MTAEAFFKELKRLINSQPKNPSHILNSENCEYGDQIYYSKNLFNAFDCSNCADSTYIYDSYMCVNCMDCDYGVESELCYESVDPYKSFNCEYLENCSNMRDSSYCYASIDCHDVFGCVHLNSKSFCIFNRQLTEGEYREAVKKFNVLPSEKILEMLEELKKRYPYTQTNDAHNENSAYGNYIYFNKNCYLCFDATRNQDSAYLYDSHRNTTCFDFTYSIDGELCYEVVDSAHCFNCNYSVFSGYCQDSSYLFNCANVKNSLGCVGISHKEYCILNRQFNKQEYDKISRRILEDLKNKNLGWADLTF